MLSSTLLLTLILQRWRGLRRDGNLGHEFANLAHSWRPVSSSILSSAFLPPITLQRRRGLRRDGNLGHEFTNLAHLWTGSSPILSSAFLPLITLLTCRGLRRDGNLGKCRSLGSFLSWSALLSGPGHDRAPFLGSRRLGAACSSSRAVPADGGPSSSSFLLFLLLLLLLLILLPGIAFWCDAGLSGRDSYIDSRRCYCKAP
mmetsp:Transcript_86292/g.228849  ORF Transcript_86292/g.228849 Transcript_86292/m.228849 type:complete len:201 (-) Transcript_86292:601-1203(-)